MSGRKSALYRSIKEHYDRKGNWENRREFVNVTKPQAARLNRQRNKSQGWIQDVHSSFTSPILRHFAGDHEWSIHEAFRFGGAQWSKEKKHSYAHDPEVVEMTTHKTNYAKGAKSPDKWLPPQGIAEYLKRREKVGQKYKGLHVTESINKVYEKHLGRKAKLPVGLSVEKTKYCTSCHIKHGIGDHRGIAKEY
jgi:hypothetical protein